METSPEFVLWALLAIGSNRIAMPLLVDPTTKEQCERKLAELERAAHGTLIGMETGGYRLPNATILNRWCGRRDGT